MHLAQNQPIKWYWIALGALLWVGFLFPDVLLLESTPMAPTTWEVQDPAVSAMTFMPGREVARYEVLHNQQMWWSNLRSMGMPVLGNDIQAAPMFPLSLVLMGLPQHLYWNVFVLLRLILMGVAGFLIASQVLRFRNLAALCFVLHFVYALHVVRWINHPWQNGLLAGLWYLYFLLKIFESTSSPWNRQQLGLTLGLAVSAYSLVTCGFPESAAMIALLVTLIHIPLFASKLWSPTGTGNFSLKNYLARYTLGHWIGLAFASPQLFAMVEFMSLTGEGFREHHGFVQYKSFDVMLNMVTPFRHGHPPGPIIHLFGLIAIFLFLLGMVTTLKNWRRLKLWDIIALLTGSFYILKVFPLWPLFNDVISRLPVVKQSHILVYFLPIFLWSFAYFSAKGMEWFQSLSQSTSVIKSKQLLLPILLAMGLFMSLFWISERVIQVSYLQWIEESALGMRILMTFMTFVMTACMYFYSPLKWRVDLRWRYVMGFMLLNLMVMEYEHNRPSRFESIKNFDSILTSTDIASLQVLPILESKQIPLQEVRFLDRHGRYAQVGLATPDSGATAVLQSRIKDFRTQLFETLWGGFMPLEKEKFPYSYRLLSNNLYLGEKAVKAAGYAPEEMTLLGAIPNGGNLYFDDQALPRAYTPKRCFVSGSQEQSFAALTNASQFQLGDAYIEKLDAEEISFCQQFQTQRKAIPIEADRGSSLTMTTIEGPTILVLQDNYYPGWKAYDDQTKQPLEIKPANGTFRALILPEARSYKVRFDYQPSWRFLFWGMLGSAIVLMGLMFWRYRSSP